jgi:hypothetical protein
MLLLCQYGQFPLWMDNQHYSSVWGVSIVNGQSTLFVSVGGFHCEWTINIICQCERFPLWMDNQHYLSVWAVSVVNGQSTLVVSVGGFHCEWTINIIYQCGRFPLWMDNQHYLSVWAVSIVNGQSTLFLKGTEWQCNNRSFNKKQNDGYRKEHKIHTSCEQRKEVQDDKTFSKATLTDSVITYTTFQHSSLPWMFWVDNHHPVEANWCCG